MADFQDCGDDVRPEYMMQMSQLAVIVSEAVRARSRAITVEANILAVQKSDEKLASWALRLPHSLQLHTISGGIDPWTANLHLHYNMALILLHRLQPQSKARAQHLGRRLDDNLEICVAAAGSIQSLFQQLCEANNLRSLWISAINCLFTALIQLSSEIRLSNPLLAVSALRRYDSALISLKQLSRHWPNAESVLHFFEKSIRVNSVETTPANGQDNSPLFVSSSNQDLRPSETGKESDLDNSHEEHLHDTIQNKSPCLVQPLPVADGRGFSQDLLGATEEIHDAWKQWQTENWSTPEFSDDYLFTF
jgi:transcriptional regulatory protein AMDR